MKDEIGKRSVEPQWYYAAMAQDSRDEQVRLTFDIEDAEKHLEHLRETAKMLGEEFNRVGALMTDHPERIFRHGASTHPLPDLDDMEILSDRTWRAFDLKRVVDLTNQIREEMTRVSGLKRRLARLS